MLLWSKQEPISPESPPPRPQLFLLSLPTEILCNILDRIPLQRTLAICCRLCKFLSPLALSRLYRHLDLRSSTRGTALPSDAPTILDDRSNIVLETIRYSPHDLGSYPTKLDFDLRSHYDAPRIGSTLALILHSCRNIVELELGRGDRGHGMPFSGLTEMIRGEREVWASRLRVLRIEECAGNGASLAAVLNKLPNLVELRLGQFLLEPNDLDQSISALRPSFRLQTFVAKYRITPFALAFSISSSANSLRTIDIPVNELNKFDLTLCSALTNVMLSLSLSTSPSLTASTTTQTSYFSNKRSNLPSQSPAALAAPALQKLADNFKSTLESIPYLTHLSIKGHWDVGDQPLDVVRHASLLSHLPPTIETLSVKTELNSIALVEWMDSITEEEMKKSRLKVLRLWQKVSFSSMKRVFQSGVREKVQDKVSEKGIKVEWYKYEKW